jgi:hypothetical protein
MSYSLDNSAAKVEKFLSLIESKAIAFFREDISTLTIKLCLVTPFYQLLSSFEINSILNQKHKGEFFIFDKINKSILCKVTIINQGESPRLVISPIKSHRKKDFYLNQVVRTSIQEVVNEDRFHALNVAIKPPIDVEIPINNNDCQIVMFDQTKSTGLLLQMSNTIEMKKGELFYRKTGATLILFYSQIILEVLQSDNFRGLCGVYTLLLPISMYLAYVVTGFIPVVLLGYPVIFVLWCVNRLIKSL